jgi:hypothetical protein
MATSQFTTPESVDVQSAAPANTDPPRRFKERRLTIGDYVSESESDPPESKIDKWLKRPRADPFLPLKGRWLAEAGFSIGGKVRVAVSPARLVIETVGLAPERLPHLPGPGNCCFNRKTSAADENRPAVFEPRHPDIDSDLAWPVLNG